MLRFNRTASVIKCVAENLPDSSSCLSVLKLQNVFGNSSLNCGNTTLKLCGINLIQTRHRHVMDDAMEPHRTFRYDKKTGLKTSSAIVLKKFFRLRWGAWIRVVRNDDDLWKENSEKQRRARQHVFCKTSQSTMLDKMVIDEYKEPHYYVDDPYEPYHNREQFIHTRRKPLPPSKNVYQYLDD